MGPSINQDVFTQICHLPARVFVWPIVDYCSIWTSSYDRWKTRPKVKISRVSPSSLVKHTLTMMLMKRSLLSYFVFYLRVKAYQRCRFRFQSLSKPSNFYFIFDNFKSRHDRLVSIKFHYVALSKLGSKRMVICKVTSMTV